MLTPTASSAARGLLARHAPPGLCAAITAATHSAAPQSTGAPRHYSAIAQRLLLAESFLLIPGPLLLVCRSVVCWGTRFWDFQSVHATLSSNTWQNVLAGPAWGGLVSLLALIDTSGTVWRVRLGGSNFVSNFTSPGMWRAASPHLFGNGIAWYGITPDDRLNLLTEYAGIYSPGDLATLYERWPDLPDQRFLAVAAGSVTNMPSAVCLITSSAYGLCLIGLPSELPRPPLSWT